MVRVHDWVKETPGVALDELSSIPGVTAELTLTWEGVRSLAHALSLPEGTVWFLMVRASQTARLNVPRNPRAVPPDVRHALSSLQAMRQAASENGVDA